MLSVPGLPALVTPSTCWLRRRRCKRRIHAAPWLCAPLPAALPEAQSSQILRATCATSQPHSLRVVPERV